MAKGADDERLVAAAQAGDAEAMDELCRRYKDAVRMLARPYYLIGADRDDLLQEGMIGLYKAVRDYRDDQNARFSSFAEVCVTRQIISAIKAASRQKHAPLNSYVSIYSSVGAREDNRELVDLLEQAGGDPEEAFIAKETAQRIRSRMKNDLTPLERGATELFLEGLTYQEIAERLSCSKKSVDNALARVKRKLYSAAR